jgi:hypothetical protein
VRDDAVDLGIELEAHELRVAGELAFLILRDAFHDLAAHCTFDGGTSLAILHHLESRIEGSLARALAAREDTPRPAVGAHARTMVRTVIQDTHARLLRERSECL